jgi:uncharacterized protein (TIGR02246 family)
MAAGGGMPCCAWQSQAPREVVDQVNRLAREYETAWNAHDAAKIASLFAEDATYLGSAGQSASGKSEIRQLVEKEHQGPLKSSTAAITVRSIRALSPSLVIVDAHTEVSGIQPQAGMQIPERMHVTSVGEKISGQWKIKALRASAAPMGPPQGVGGAGGAGVDRKR